MAVVKKKIWPEYFDSVANGEKTFDLRLDDFELQEGDTLVLEEWDPNTQKYTGRSVSKKVGYVMNIDPDDLPFWETQEIEEKGLKVISLL